MGHLPCRGEERSRQMPYVLVHGRVPHTARSVEGEVEVPGTPVLRGDGQRWSQGRTAEVVRVEAVDAVVAKVGGPDPEVAGHVERQRVHTSEGQLGVVRQGEGRG